jgi:hypothetical protein
MTPNPNEGGSYTQQPDGTLQRVSYTEDHPEGNRPRDAEGRPLAADGRPLPPPTKQPKVKEK